MKLENFRFRVLFRFIYCISLHLYPSHVYSSSIDHIFLLIPVLFLSTSLVSVYFSKKKDLSFSRTASIQSIFVHSSFIQISKPQGIYQCIYHQNKYDMKGLQFNLQFQDCIKHKQVIILKN